MTARLGDKLKQQKPHNWRRLLLAARLHGETFTGKIVHACNFRIPRWNKSKYPPKRTREHLSLLHSCWLFFAISRFSALKELICSKSSNALPRKETRAPGSLNSIERVNCLRSISMFECRMNCRKLVCTLRYTSEELWCVEKKEIKTWMMSFWKYETLKAQLSYKTCLNWNNIAKRDRNGFTSKLEKAFVIHAFRRIKV